MGRKSREKKAKRLRQGETKLREEVRVKLVAKLKETGFLNKIARESGVAFPEDWFEGPGLETMDKIIAMHRDTGQSLDEVIDGTADWLTKRWREERPNFNAAAGRMLAQKDALFRLPGAQSGGVSVSKGRRLVVELYTRTLLMMQQAAAGDEDAVDVRSSNLLDADAAPDSVKRQSAKERSKGNAAYLWAWLSEASIFEIPLGLYQRLYHEADVDITRRAGHEWEPEGMGNPNLEEESEKYTRVMMDVGSKIAFPEFMPFDFMFLAFDQPWQLADCQDQIFGIVEGNAKSYWMFGFLLAQGHVHTMYIADYGEWSGIHIVCERKAPHASQEVADRGKWLFPGSLSPWVINWLIQWINEHKVIIEESTKKFSYRNDVRTTAKRLKVKKQIPSPYYTIYMNDEIVKELDRKPLKTPPRTRKAQEHRSKVRGHYCIRVMSGTLPLDPELEKKLRKDKRRKIYKTEPLDAETLHDLAVRGMKPKKVGEWMSVLKYRRDWFFRGPEDAPFVPALRKSGRKKRRRNG